MSNFDLIDDYVTNRLSGEDREAFEKELATDPALKAEVELQQQVVASIQKARAAELKSMLNNVPVGQGMQVEFSVVRLAAGLAAAGVLAASLYYYYKPEIQLQDASTDLLKKGEQLKGIDSTATEEPSIREEEPAIDEPAANEKKEEKPEVKKGKKAVPVKTSAVQKPQIEVSDPTEDLESNAGGEEQVSSATPRGVHAPANVEIEVDSSNKKYDFHYQFNSNKLMLYGTFDKSLYELLEINGEQPALFLVYKEKYYFLDPQQRNITLLKPINDGLLLKKLKT